jgi:hypothetical protein
MSNMSHVRRAKRRVEQKAQEAAREAARQEWEAFVASMLDVGRNNGRIRVVRRGGGAHA